MLCSQFKAFASFVYGYGKHIAHDDKYFPSVADNGGIIFEFHFRCEIFRRKLRGFLFQNLIPDPEITTNGRHVGYLTPINKDNANLTLNFQSTLRLLSK